MMFLLLLQIIAVVLLLTTGVWLTALGLITAFSQKLKTHGGNLIIGPVIGAVGIWLTIVFGWVQV